MDIIFVHIFLCLTIKYFVLSNPFCPQNQESHARTRAAKCRVMGARVYRAMMAAEPRPRPRRYKQINLNLNLRSRRRLLQLLSRRRLRPPPGGPEHFS